MIAGRNVELTESSGNDVVDKLAVEQEELVGNPRTTIGAQFSVLHENCRRIYEELYCHE